MQGSIVSVSDARAIALEEAGFGRILEEDRPVVKEPHVVEKPKAKGKK